MNLILNKISIVDNKLKNTAQMKEFRKIALLIFAFLYYTITYAQDNVIRGRVVDKYDNIPVIGANVIEYDKENRVVNGTICNVNGDFVLEMQDVTNIVKISLIGYNTQQIKVSAGKSILVKLAVTSQEIEEIYVTAKSESRHSLTNVDERDIASSRVKIDMAEMKDVGALSAADALQGKVSGLDIISSSGDPGSGSQITIRGLGSMGNSQPLVIIDGIEQGTIDEDFDLSSSDSEDIGNQFNIAVQDIKSIEVLKDAASTAIYGSKGADGVLLIETYRGKLGKVEFDYSYKMTFNFQPKAIPMLNGDEYIMLQLEEWHNSDGIYEIPDEIAYDQDYEDFYNYSANTDWVDAITQNSLTHEHYFKVSGGGEKTRYFTSVSYLDQGGTTLNTGYKRFSTRMNLDYFLSRKLRFSISFNYINEQTEGNYVPDDEDGQDLNVREMAYIKSPNMSIWEYDEDGEKTGEYFTPIDSYQGEGQYYYNPVAVADLSKDDKGTNSLQNSFVLNYNLKEWLTLRQTISFSFSGTKENSYVPYNAIGVNWLNWLVNYASENNSSSYAFSTESQVAFDVPFKTDQHVLSGSAAWITRRSGYEWTLIQSNRLSTTDIQDPAVNGQVNWIGNGSADYRELGAFISVNYKFQDRYMFQGNLRADSYSTFGANNRWGFFEGLSFGWRFSDEPFLHGLSFLGESKLRLSWGVSGRQPSSAYARFATYESGSTYLSNATVSASQIQLDNLKWETCTSYDLGLELNLFKDRLFIEADLYKKITTDLLFEGYEIPSSSGYDELAYFNGGQMENIGWELMLDWKILRTKDFRWSVNFNISRNKNTFVKLPDNYNTEKSTSVGNGEYPQRIVEGEAIGSFFGFKYKGVYPSDEDAYAHDVDGNVLADSEGVPIPMTYLSSYQFEGGDAKYADLNHDGNISLADVEYIGDSNPDFIGGFGTSVRYKSFDFTCGFHYRLGFDIINMVALETQGMNDKNNQSKAVLARWRVEGQDEEGMLPRAYMNHPANNLGSDRYVEAGDYLRLLNLTVGYRFSREMCERLKVREFQISLGARKMFTLTQYTGQDPEIAQDASDPFWIGVDEAKTPPSQMIIFNVAVGF